MMAGRHFRENGQGIVDFLRDSLLLWGHQKRNLDTIRHSNCATGESSRALKKCDRLWSGAKYSNALVRQIRDEPVVPDESLLCSAGSWRQKMVQPSLSLKAQPINLDRLGAAVDEGYAGGFL